MTVPAERVAQIITGLRQLVHPDRVDAFDAWVASFQIQAASKTTPAEADAAHFTLMLGTVLLEGVNDLSAEQEPIERTMQLFNHLGQVMGYELGRLMLQLIADDAPVEDAACMLGNQANLAFANGFAKAMHHVVNPQENAPARMM